MEMKIEGDARPRGRERVGLDDVCVVQLQGKKTEQRPEREGERERGRAEGFLIAITMTL
jgi:hypothetical protein